MKAASTAYLLEEYRSLSATKSPTIQGSFWKRALTYTYVWRCMEAASTAYLLEEYRSLSTKQHITQQFRRH